MFTAPIAYKLISADLSASLERTAQQPQVKRESENYLAKIGGIKSIDDFMSNDRIYSFAMTAFGLDDMTYAKAYMRKVLTEGIDKSDSFANRLADPRFKEFVETFNFARHGTATTAFGRAQQGTVDRYVQQTLEVDAGRENEGVRLALYFRRKAPGVTNPLQLLADRALLKVTQVALGIPASTGALDINKQSALITKRFDIADLKDPDKLNRLIERFTALWEVENPTSAGGNVPGVLIGSTPFGIDVDTLARIQTLRLGR